jgi:predicted RNase H-like nuclease (RuvC/YqgF family)
MKYMVLRHVLDAIYHMRDSLRENARSQRGNSEKCARCEKLARSLREAVKSVHELREACEKAARLRNLLDHTFTIMHLLTSNNLHI